MDEDRRTKLRAFLIDRRARLTPNDVGLPATAHRRVVGLRREEVAELVGVSSDWYRWFESGRPIRVSVPFLAKLCKALRLSPHEQISLYCLALPEIYAAYMEQQKNVVPFRPAKASRLRLLAVLRSQARIAPRFARAQGE